MILPMGIVSPPSIKAIMGIITSPVCLASAHSPWAVYLIPTVEGILYLEQKFLIPSSDSTRHRNGFFCFPIFLKDLAEKTVGFEIKVALQQNVTTVTNFSEENIFVTKKYHIVTKFIFCH